MMIKKNTWSKPLTILNAGNVTSRITMLAYLRAKIVKQAKQFNEYLAFPIVDDALDPVPETKTIHSAHHLEHRRAKVKLSN